ncbi:hypothetical protein CSC43_0102 [Pseudomonas aeruginosa]|nr:hypothetical protein CSC43_0102 [Pseudomonas aeruginosa]
MASSLHLRLDSPAATGFSIHRFGRNNAWLKTTEITKTTSWAA